MSESSVSPETASLPPRVAELFSRIVASGPLDERKRWGPAWVMHYVKEIPRRRQFMKEFGWSVPTPVAIGVVRNFVGDRRLLEVGAGTGLWAYLLSAFGVSVTATDDYSWTATDDPSVKVVLPSGFSVDQGRFFPVEPIEAVQAVRKYADHKALLICWPPPDRPMAYYALLAFPGDRFVYIGDKAATADDQFHALLAEQWRQHSVVYVPTWPGIHDAIYLYERKLQPWTRRSTGRPANPTLTSS